MDFNTWKTLPPVEEMATRIGFGAELSRSLNWDDYTSRFIQANDDGGKIVKAAQDLWGYLSTGERPVLAAMLHAADFSSFADRWSDGEVWRDLDRTYGKHAAAVAFAILRQ
ncbi:hypothetical protein J5J10_04875 [Ciceribacter sp. L1K23]|uniref:hypothetical protein n=1 Tax=Ciceribacter sp. L1K23 TaxID=2820276 RepID=UPI001B83D90F|nr:hypothetical protein [Ciceribacter sp. L1K23]MBR0555008.1 hypothetical protein [Ciceribacter sp. L1K23]